MCKCPTNTRWVRMRPRLGLLSQTSPAPIGVHVNAGQFEDDYAAGYNGRRRLEEHDETRRKEVSDLRLAGCASTRPAYSQWTLGAFRTVRGQRRSDSSEWQDHRQIAWISNWRLWSNPHPAIEGEAGALDASLVNPLKQSRPRIAPSQLQPYNRPTATCRLKAFAQTQRVSLERLVTRNLPRRRLTYESPGFLLRIRNEKPLSGRH
jgi:hypothetical protein